MLNKLKTFTSTHPVATRVAVIGGVAVAVIGVTAALKKSFPLDESFEVLESV